MQLAFQFVTTSNNLHMEIIDLGFSFGIASKET